MEDIPEIPTFTKYFRICYYMCVIPFKIDYNTTERCWSISRSKIQLLFCFTLFWMPVLLLESVDYIQIFINYTHSPISSAKATFQLYYYVSFTLRWTVYLWVVTFRSADIKCAFDACTVIFDSSPFQYKSVAKNNFVAHSCNRQNRINLHRKRANVYFMLLCGICAMLLIIGALTAPQRRSPAHTPSEAFFKRVQLHRKKLFLGELPANSTLGIEDVILGIVATYVNYVIDLAGISIELLLVGSYPIVIWLAVNEYQLFLENAENIGNANKAGHLMETITNKYEQLKRLSDSLNKICAHLYFIWIFNMALRTMFAAYVHRNNVGAASMVIRMANVGTTLIPGGISLMLAAETFVKMNQYKQWLMRADQWGELNVGECKSQVDRILIELADNPVGISWSGRCHCTYGFLAQLLALLLTIFVVSFEQT